MAKKIISAAFVWFALLLMYLPIFFLIVLSFTESRAFGAWEGFSFGLYTSLFENEAILRATGNTLIIGAVSSFVATFVGTISAIGIYSMKRRAQGLINAANQITILNADIVTAVALMIFFVTIGLAPGYGTLIVAHILITTPYVVLNVMPRLTALNPNMFEAALDLGATPFKAVFKVLLPQLIPGMISGFVLAFTLSIDDFIISNYNNGTVDTLSTYIYKDAARRGLSPELRSLSAIMFVVVLAVLIVVNIAASKRKAKEEKLNAL